MWQRPQTVLLAVASVCMAIMIFFPLWVGTDAEGTHVVMYAMYLKLGDSAVYQPYTLVSVLAVAGITVAILEITRFKNRILQIKLGALNSLFLGGSLIAIVYFIRSLDAIYTGGYSYAIFLPAVAMIANSIASRLIRKDENLVRESDRLR